MRVTGDLRRRYGEHPSTASVHAPNLHLRRSGLTRVSHQRGGETRRDARLTGLLIRCSAEVCQDRQDAAVAVLDLVETELSEDAADVCLDRLVGDDELRRDGRVRTTLSDEPQNLALAIAQGGQRIRFAGSLEQPGDDRRID